MICRRQFLHWSLAHIAIAGLLPSICRSSNGSSSWQAIVHILENQPRDKLLSILVEKISGGLTYSDLFSAICIAGCKNVAPYPSVGFKYHSVMMMHAVHLSTINSADKERWLPILWAADTFKYAQLRERDSGDWQMKPVFPVKGGSQSKSLALFKRAMDSWDYELADSAISQLIHSSSLAQVFEVLFLYACRDFRDIGHKAIATANCHKVLQVIGEQHADTLIRSLVYALLNHEGEPNPSQSDLKADSAWRSNCLRLNDFPQNWLSGKVCNQATTDVLRAISNEQPEALTLIAINLFNKGFDPKMIWDAVLLSAAELIMQRSSIIPVHANTTANAMFYIFRVCQNWQTKKMLLLQALSFMVSFRKLLRGDKRPLDILTFQAKPLKNQFKNQVAEIFTKISFDRVLAAKNILSFQQQGGSPKKIFEMARYYTIHHNTGYHDYKFTEAMLENYQHISPHWRAHYLSASSFYLNGSEDESNKVVIQIQELLRSRYQ